MFPFVINRTSGYTLDDDEEEVTNGTISSGFSYTVESISNEVSCFSQLFMNDYIYSLDNPSMMFMVDVINPSFVEAEVVDFVCLGIRECGDIRQLAPLYLFTRDVSCPATTKVVRVLSIGSIIYHVCQSSITTPLLCLSYAPYEQFKTLMVFMNYWCYF